MKIDAVELTLFAWDDIPPTQYTLGLAEPSGTSNLGLLRIKTDAGIEGHAFLGSATNPAETDAGALIRFLKPVLMGKDPLAREDLHAAMRMRQRNMGLRTIGACDTALWDIAAKAAGMPLYKFPRRRRDGDRRLCLEPGARQPAGLCRGGAAVQGRRLEGLQDPPAADPAARTSRCAKPCARRSATTTR